ncbi:site-specific integrase [Clostridium sp. DJ247]|uniref:tyrosine-type recombinase/integrase n=1 Tax=Clostridium sp. DJ247 TaxID=2726188 RepID=UPI001623943D|nr:site-specific integrase [Clostridium sp. DJ247]MBC2579058.1 tyrosine-type recombinase/integrase [Clostridium sp. DJ247]
MNKADFPRHLSYFLSKYLPGQKNASTHTIASYRDTIKLFLMFCQEEKSMRPETIRMSELTKELIVGYLDWLEEKRGCSISTRNHRLAVLHSFFQYVQKETPENLFEIQRILSIPSKKHPKAIVPYLTGTEMKILLEQPDSSTYEGFRDMVLLSVLYDTGARVQELTSIKIKDVRLSEPAVIILHGKGSKVRQIPLMGRTSELITKYLEIKKYNYGLAKADNYLFVNQKQQKLSRWGISYILNKYVEIAKENPLFSVNFPVTPHVLRHAKAMHLLQSGVNLIYIRDFLGHVDCSTTEVYARADSEMKRKAIENAYTDLVPNTAPKWEEDGDLMNWLNTLCE